MQTRTVTRVVYRCSIDGRFVSQRYAELHPRISVRQTIRVCLPCRTRKGRRDRRQ